MGKSGTAFDLRRLTASPEQDVVCQELEGEIVLLSLKSGEYYGLNGVGSSIWAGLQACQRPSEIIEVLLDRYEVARETLEGDLQRFLSDLAALGLVTLREDSR